MTKRPGLRERSSFVAQALRKELEAVKRQKLLDYLQTLEPQSSQDSDSPSSAEIIRSLREDRAKKLINNLSS
ncbi:MAG: hypothetical protein HWE20_03910 [Gammaproteobacteria bacterium]|nr:hypothetical protein [Gammaproteobacteria bacterium]